MVSAGYTEHDDLLAVGVVPIAVTNWFRRPGVRRVAVGAGKLGSAEPVVLQSGQRHSRSIRSPYSNPI